MKNTIYYLETDTLSRYIQNRIITNDWTYDCAKLNMIYCLVQIEKIEKWEEPKTDIIRYTL